MNVIRAPKPRPREAKFAGIAPGTVCSVENLGRTPNAVVKQHTFTCGHEEWNARHVDTWEALWINPDELVTPLALAPIEPKQHPDVCTYGELRIGEHFRWEDDGLDQARGLCQRVNGGYTDEKGGAWQCPAVRESSPVRRVSASVVEHEEPGLGDYVKPDGDGFRILGGPLRTRADAGYIVRQITAWLAQQATSPESGEPERRAADCQACQGAECCECGEGSLAPEPAESAADARCTYRGALAECHDLHCPVHGGRRIAEDRSKPAPNVSVEPRGHGSGYRISLAAPMSEEESVRLSWVLSDAQQAGGGGE